MTTLHLDNSSKSNRRSFVTVAVTIVAGAAAILTPLMAGLVTFFSARFKKNSSSKVRIVLLDQVPDDGIPRLFPVVTDRVDAWTRYSDGALERG